ncbi:MAG TPA: hypothetical protein DDZ83_12335 [Nitrospinae bacterium]|nr:hypothetical protein [Nitrospinota bacterium]
MDRKIVVPAAVFLGFGAVYGYLTAYLSVRTLPNTPGPSFFPWILTACLIFLSSALLIQEYRASKSGRPSVPEEAKPKVSRPAGLFLFVPYLIALPFVGFLAASIPFFAGMMIASGERNKTMIAAASIAIPLFLYLLFQHVFQIPMPKGSMVDW